jgi:predicted SprT family Zn-dependent metalloprotease
MTFQTDKKAFARLIKENPGDAHTYRCKCGQVYQTSDNMPPAILCPECGEAIVLEAKDRKQ